MSRNQALEITNPTVFRSFVNEGEEVIPENRIIKMTGTSYLGGDLATSAADRLWGISTEPVSPGISSSIQVAQVAVVETGGAFARGDKLTSDAQGRAVEAGEEDSVIGIAAQPSTGAGEFVGVELAYKLSSVGNVQMLEVTVGHADLTAAATSQTVNIGDALPEDARILSVESDITELFAGGTISDGTVSLGVSGSLTAIINARGNFTGDPTGPAVANGARPHGSYSEAQLQAQFQATGGNVAAYTAGSITFRILYTVQ